MTPPTPLTTSQLARYIGKRVEYDIIFEEASKSGYVWHNDKTNDLSLDMLQWYEDGSIRNIRPVLRRLSSITEEEVMTCFRLAFNVVWLPDEVSRKPDAIEVSGCGQYLAIELRDGFPWMSASIDLQGHDLPSLINACAVVDFLDEIGIDQRGYIEKGLAVEKKEVSI